MGRFSTKLCFSWIISFVSITFSIRSNGKLSIWISDRVMEENFGVPIEVFIIKEGRVVPYLRNPKVFGHLPPIPNDVNLIKITWKAGKNNRFHYTASLKSLDRLTLYDPLLFIPETGIIPQSREDFDVSVSCTGRRTAIAFLQITLYISNRNGQSIEGSPLRLKMAKQCIALKRNRKRKTMNFLSCDSKCQNNGKCNEHGECVCKENFFGVYCENAKCEEPCLNGGKCISPGKCICQDGYTGNQCQILNYMCRDVCRNGGRCVGYDICKCPRGYSGETCEKPICRRVCSPHGRCVSADMCECDIGWRGRYCNKRQKSPSMRMYRKLYRRRRKRERDRARRQQLAQAKVLNTQLNREAFSQLQST